MGTILGVFTGTALNNLINVASGNNSEGPHCPFSQQEFTFKAIDGTTYKIAVDGNGFYLPDWEKPVTEGSITLRIEARPPPVNDDFQNATTLEGEMTEEPGGNRFYWVSTFGFNWGGTKEVGEPDHAGDPGGASVWYAWTAPESGVARINGCCDSQGLLGVYVGNAVNTLIPAEPTADPPLGASFAVSAGTTYRIAVDGKFDEGANEANMGSFTVRASMELPPLEGDQSPSPTIGPARDVSAPSTIVHRRKVQSRKRRAIFAFRSTETGSTFRCKLDKRAFGRCASPKTYKNLAPGGHTFKVVALDLAGNVDPSPAVSRFHIVKPKKR